MIILPSLSSIFTILILTLITWSSKSEDKTEQVEHPRTSFWYHFYSSVGTSSTLHHNQKPEIISEKKNMLVCYQLVCSEKKNILSVIVILIKTDKRRRQMKKQTNVTTLKTFLLHCYVTSVLWFLIYRVVHQEPSLSIMAKP